MSAAAVIIGELTYASYAANRDYGMAPERLAALLAIDPASAEERYQREKRERPQPKVLTLHDDDAPPCRICGQAHCFIPHADERWAR